MPSLSKFVSDMHKDAVLSFASLLLFWEFADGLILCNQLIVGSNSYFMAPHLDFIKYLRETPGAFTRLINCHKRIIPTLVGADIGTITTIFRNIGTLCDPDGPPVSILIWSSDNDAPDEVSDELATALEMFASDEAIDLCVR